MDTRIAIVLGVVGVIAFVIVGFAALFAAQMVAGKILEVVHRHPKIAWIWNITWMTLVVVGFIVWHWIPIAIGVTMFVLVMAVLFLSDD
ncbi:hypothetical protein [Nocardia sp. NPDC005366]|uniref:hypothetical protein n=1 Tax=Nocardia sp. NPDC005366 TaxID=3156878 RepID=UPI0033AE05C7